MTDICPDCGKPDALPDDPPGDYCRCPFPTGGCYYCTGPLDDAGDCLSVECRAAQVAYWQAALELLGAAP